MSVAELPMTRAEAPIERLITRRTGLGAVVVLPTYNERENLPEMLRTLRTLSPGLDILVVDDNSPDGTGEIAQDWASRNPAVHVLHRKNQRGLGSAYHAGFEYALAHGATAIVTMDCDFSHSPGDIPRLLGGLNRADLVIGSRYVRGGATRNWPWMRRVLSAAANQFARRTLKLPVRDCTAGFRAYSGPLMRQLLNEPVVSNGYTIQVELVSKAIHRHHARVIELPIVFSERERGQSKVTRREVTRGLAAILGLRRTLFRVDK